MIADGRLQDFLIFWNFSHSHLACDQRDKLAGSEVTCCSPGLTKMRTNSNVSYYSSLLGMLESLHSDLLRFVNSLQIIETARRHIGLGHIIVAPAHYDSKLTSHQHVEQMRLNKEFQKINSRLLRLSRWLPQEAQQALAEATTSVKEEIEVSASVLPFTNREANSNRIGEWFRTIHATLAPFRLYPSNLILVPDTNALILCPDFSAYRRLIPDPGQPFSIVIPPTVLGELDNLKHSSRPENFRAKVKSVIKRIKGLRGQGKLTEGVKYDKNITVLLEITKTRFDAGPEWLNPSVPDDQIIAATLEIQVMHPTSPVILVTADINLQNKAEAAQIPYTEPPEHED